MNKDAKIYIAGHNGMVGSAIWRTLTAKGYTNLIGASSKELDLRNQQAVKDFMATENPLLTLPQSGGILIMIFRTSLSWKTCKSKII
jgi:GDP-L-fucose synthase